MKTLFTLLTLSCALLFSGVILAGCSSAELPSNTNETGGANTNSKVVIANTNSESSTNEVANENIYTNTYVESEELESTTVSQSEDSIIEEDTLYYVEGETPMLLLNNKLYADTKGRIVSQDEAVDDFSVLTKNKIIPILKLPERSNVFDVLDGKDIRETLFFSIESDNYVEYLASSNGAIGHGNKSIDVYSYDTINDEIKSLFSSQDPDIDGKYIVFLDSYSNHLLAVNLYSCWNCEAPYPETYLWNVDKRKGKNIGRVLKFQWKHSLGGYRYKEYITEECDNPFTGGQCPVDADTVEWQKADFIL